MNLFVTTSENVLPQTKYETSYYKALYFGDVCRGVMLDKTRKGDPRWYSFEVAWKAGMPRVTVSVASGDSFEEFAGRAREHNGSTSYYDVRGMAQTHRRELHQRAVKIGAHVRERFMRETDWLFEAFEAAPKINISASLISCRDGVQGAPEVAKSLVVFDYAFKDGWLITVRPHYCGKEILAERLASGSSIDDAERTILERQFLPKEPSKFVQQRIDQWMKQKVSSVA